MSSNSHGYIGINDFTFTWEISNYSSLEKYDSVIYSKTFFIGEMQWLLYLKTNKQETDFLSIFLRNKTLQNSNSNNQEINVSYELSLLNKHWQKTKKFSSTHTFDNNLYNWGLKNFISKTFLNVYKDKLLFKDKMIISCRVHINSFQDNVFQQEAELSNDYELLFKFPVTSDLTIHVGGEKLYAHKIILTARSEVFAAMFQHNMTENNLNEIKITDISCEVMREVLRFIYSGKIHNIEKLAEPLIIAADKYNLNTLKTTCEKVIWKTLSSENACEVLKLTETHNCTQLKSEIIKFIVKNMKEIVNTPEFTELTNYHSSLVREILHEVVKHKYD